MERKLALSSWVKIAVTCSSICEKGKQHIYLKRKRKGRQKKHMSSEKGKYNRKISLSNLHVCICMYSICCSSRGKKLSKLLWHVYAALRHLPAIYANMWPSYNSYGIKACSMCCSMAYITRKERQCACLPSLACVTGMWLIFLCELSLVIFKLAHLMKTNSLIVTKWSR